VYVGSKTGRDGIHGATMASAEFDDDSEEKRPTVQVGDPFTEKLLIEACLELMAGDAIVAIQDMGAAGLTSSSVEMASKGGVGIEINLDKVPNRETSMTAYEMMLSESQERMLMVLKPGREEDALAVFDKWGLDFSVIGEVTDSGRLTLLQNGETVADIPLDILADNAPEYDRPHEPTPPAREIDPADILEPADPCAALAWLMGGPELSSRRWIWEQYDHMVMADAVQRPGGDAAVVRVHGTQKGLAITTDCTPRYCQADPVRGGRQAVAEAWRNITAVGAKPLAITDCLNFGNPERPEIMGQFAGAIQGMGEACRALDFPVVSGNVSFYNETNGKGVPPTPAVGAVGVLETLSSMATLAFKAEGSAIVLVGETTGHLSASLYLRDMAGREEGTPPPVDLTAERRNGDWVRECIGRGLLRACHDISDGGLLVAVAEMALAGDVGATIEPDLTTLPRHAFLFGEDQARYVLEVGAGQLAEVLEDAVKQGVPVTVVGHTGGEALTVDGKNTISLTDLRMAHEGWFPDFMASR
ncbi:MAG: phosphoribosylformylglycinamidine synthase subunit PurL, partial [Sphingomonadales bacterium]